MLDSSAFSSPAYISHRFSASSRSLTDCAKRTQVTECQKIVTTGRSHMLPPEYLTLQCSSLVKLAQTLRIARHLHGFLNFKVSIEPDIQACPWESHGKHPMGWDRHKLLWDGNGTDKYVPWTTLLISLEADNPAHNGFLEVTLTSRYYDMACNTWSLTVQQFVSPVLTPKNVMSSLWTSAACEVLALVIANFASRVKHAIFCKKNTL